MLHHAITRPARPSRVTTPMHCHHLVRLTFELMKATGTTYSDLSWRSGVLVQSVKEWRRRNIPSLRSIEAVLGAFDWKLTPTPPLDVLPDEVRAKIEDIGQHFRSDDEVLAAALAYVASTPKPHVGPTKAPKIDYRSKYWLERSV